MAAARDMKKFALLLYADFFRLADTGSSKNYCKLLILFTYLFKIRSDVFFEELVLQDISSQKL